MTGLGTHHSLPSVSERSRAPAFALVTASALALSVGGCRGAPSGDFCAVLARTPGCGGPAEACQPRLDFIRTVSPECDDALDAFTTCVAGLAPLACGGAWNGVVAATGEGTLVSGSESEEFQFGDNFSVLLRDRECSIPLYDLWLCRLGSAQAGLEPRAVPMGGSCAQGETCWTGLECRAGLCTRACSAFGECSIDGVFLGPIQTECLELDGARRCARPCSDPSAPVCAALGALSCQVDTANGGYYRCAP